MIFFSVLGDLAVSLNLNPLYLMLPAAVIIINILMLIMIVIIANQSWLSWGWCGWRWSCWSLIINADDDGSQVTCCYAFMLPVACPTNAIVYKASGSKIMMIMIIDYDQHKVLSGYFSYPKIMNPWNGTVCHISSLGNMKDEFFFVEFGLWTL